MLSAFVSVTFACKHQKFIGNILLENIPQGRPNALWGFKRWFQESGNKGDKGKTRPAKPRLPIVLLLSGTKMFFNWSLIAYVVGLGVYLGSMWRRGLDADASPSDSRNIFIVFLLCATIWYCVYFALVFFANLGELEGWRKYLDKFDDPPCLDGDCSETLDSRQTHDKHSETQRIDDPKSPSHSSRQSEV